MQLTLARVLRVVFAILVIGALVFDLLVFGPASHAMDPSLPSIPFRF